MKKTTKLLGIVLCLTMLLTAMPIVSSAIEPSFLVNETLDTTFEIPQWVQYQGWYHNNAFVDKETSEAKKSYFEVKDGALHIHRDSTEKCDASIGYKLQDPSYSLNKGIVTVKADLKMTGGGKLNGTSNGSIYSGLFAVGNNSWGSTLATHNATNLRPFGYNDSTTFSSTFNTDDWCTVTGVFDYTAKTLTVTYQPKDGEAQTASTEITDTEGIKYVSFGAACTNIELDYDAKSDVDLYIANFSVTQVLNPEVSSMNVANGEKGVYLNKTFSIDFATAIDADSAKNITLNKADGTVVDADVTANGTNVTLAPKALLEPLTQYTLSVANTVTASDVAVVAKSVSFYTGRLVKANGYSADFNDFTAEESATVGAIMNTLNKSKMTDWKTAIGIGSGNYIWYTGTEGGRDENDANFKYKDAAATPMFGGDYNKVSIENGKLKMWRKIAAPEGKNTTQNSFRIALNDPNDFEQTAGLIESGIVNIHFDMELDRTFSSWYNTSWIEIAGRDKTVTSGDPSKTLFKLNAQNSNLYFQGADEGTSWNAKLIKSDFAAGSYSFDFEINLDTDTVTVKINDVACVTDGKINDWPLNALAINHNATWQNVTTNADGTPIEWTMTLDNIAIEPVAAPSVLQTAITGFNKNQVVVDFDSLMTAPTGDITMTKGSDSVAVTAALADNGYQYILKSEAELADGDYIITIPSQTAASGLTSEATTVTYTLKTGGNDTIAISDYNLTGTVTAGSAVKVSAGFTNKTETAQKPWLGLALYDKDDKLVKVAIGEKDLTGNETATASASFIVPDDIEEGAYIRVFAWEAGANMVPLCKAIQ